MTRRVLVSGGAGFIGSHVVEAYLAAGDEVSVLDDLSTGKAENVPSAAKLVRADIRSPEARALVAGGGFTVLNHHAAQMDVRRSVEDPVFDAQVNVLGLLNLLEGARAGGVHRIVFASSGGTVYGEGAPTPTTETAAKLPASPYGTAKLTSEYYLATFAQLYGLEAVALRYANVYGPRQNPHGEAGVVAIFGKRLLQGEPITIYGNGEQTRDLVYVEDVAAANLLAAERPLPALQSLDSRAFNIGTGIETSVNRLADLIVQATGRAGDVRRAPARAGEILRSALAVTKAERELGWRPRVPLPDGLARTMRWIAEG
ncbi:MAG TPA: NAD-dependent epimerase/dehydratase family protein [Gemmatimonadales bacterium]|nr:NAD-dependent epimerase/dehydratase family protein [Gemmatimonadales bacterium]